ncbi:MAG: hypothetical protein JHD01_06425, partial [Candidatus Nanopelagicales bacterium]|nr:hypothetical protein [Candidatus Nanopelagicales bacterium]
EQVNEITGKTATKLQSLKRTIEGLCNQNYYEKWSENFVPNASGSELDEATMENYKSAFTINSFKEDLTQYFPLIHSIMQEAGEVNLEEYVSEQDIDEATALQSLGGNPRFNQNRPMPHQGAAPWEDDVKKLATIEPVDRYSAYANILSYFKDNPEVSQMASDLMGGYYEADMLRGKYKTDAAKAKYDELEPMNQAFIKQALGQEQGDEEPPFEPDTTSNFSKPKNPNRTGRDAAQALAHRGMKQVSPAESINAFEEWANDLVEGDSDEDMMTPPKETEHPTAKAIAEFVYTMYNKEHKKQGLGPFPKGDTGVISAVTNKFGEKTEEIATQFVEFLSNGSVEKTADEGVGVVDTVKKVGRKVGGAIKKAAGQAMDIIAPGDDELLRRLREPNKPESSGVPEPMAIPNSHPKNESSEFDIILKLAGIKEGSGPKEKRPFVDRNSPESQAKIQAARDKITKDEQSNPGKELADKINKKK